MQHSSRPPDHHEGAPGAPSSPLHTPRSYPEIYAGSLALLTDLYEITMAYGYFREGDPQREAIFVLSFRETPFNGGYAIACGLAAVVDYLERLRFSDDDREYLATLAGRDGARLFDRAFLDYLASLRFECDLDMVPEGTVVFGHEPLLRVRGPILQAQIVESALLNIVNFQSLIATKASRVVAAARGDPVLEFGLRRAQGFDGGLSASRAAFIGGCASTSNTLAGKLFGIPVGGTHAHSWVMSFDAELAAFDAYARALPGNVILLVDTYDTLEGVRRAISAGERLRENGHDLVGIRLDSGDLAYLSMEARKLLDAAGFESAAIYASNDLDETIIESLKVQGARITAWGVGTHLVTGGEQPALGGTYKLTALREADGSWSPRIKLSEQAAKTSLPGLLQTRRFSREGEFVGDMIYDEHHPPVSELLMIDPLDSTRAKEFGEDCSAEDLLIPVMVRGMRVSEPESLAAARFRAADQLRRFHPGIKRFVNPHAYPVGLERSYHERRSELIRAARGRK